MIRRRSRWKCRIQGFGVLGLGFSEEGFGLLLGLAKPYSLNSKRHNSHMKAQCHGLGLSRVQWLKTQLAVGLLSSSCQGS